MLVLFNLQVFFFFATELIIFNFNANVLGVINKSNFMSDKLGFNRKEK